MGFSKENLADLAKKDLAERLNIGESEISVANIEDKDFPNMSLGAPSNGEMAAQMISSGWKIELATDGKSYEYRGDKYQLRLHNFNGENFVIK